MIAGVFPKTRARDSRVPACSFQVLPLTRRSAFQQTSQRCARPCILHHECVHTTFQCSGSIYIKYQASWASSASFRNRFLYHATLGAPCLCFL